jgi:hypothetical protein
MGAVVDSRMIPLRSTFSFSSQVENGIMRENVHIQGHSIVFKGKSEFCLCSQSAEARHSHSINFNKTEVIVSIQVCPHIIREAIGVTNPPNYSTIKMNTD